MWRTKYGRYDVCFHFPEWYRMTQTEVDKLFSYILEASCAEEARLFRKLDCSAFCRELLCYFCGKFSPPSQSNDCVSDL